MHANLRAAYPPEHIGRALSLFAMTVCGAIAEIKCLTGMLAALAQSQNRDPLASAMIMIGGPLPAAVAYSLLPWPEAMLRRDIEHRSGIDQIGAHRYLAVQKIPDFQAEMEIKCLDLLYFRSGTRPMVRFIAYLNELPDATREVAAATAKAAIAPY